MASKANPGAFDCYAAARPREPMFVLLGRDRHAPLLVRLWARARKLSGEDADKVEEALNCAEQMHGWLEAQGKELDYLSLFADLSEAYHAVTAYREKLASEEKEDDAIDEACKRLHGFLLDLGVPVPVRVLGVPVPAYVSARG